MSKISFVINYAGLQLAVSKNEKGEDVTPLKPISDLFGLAWRDQRKRVLATPGQVRRFGISGEDTLTSKAGSGEGILTSNGDSEADSALSERNSRGQGPELFIRIDRVAYYLMSINAEKVRVAGNVDGADFLDKKQEEWADALHDYEELGTAVNLNHVKVIASTNRQRLQFLQAMGVKNKMTDMADRRALTQIMQKMAAEIGITYQPDLLDGA